MSFDRNFWAKHFKSNLATKKPKLIYSDLVGAGNADSQINMVSPLQQEIIKNEIKVKKKRKRNTNSKIRKKRRKITKNKTIKRTVKRKKNQTTRKRGRKRKSK